MIYVFNIILSFILMETIVILSRKWLCYSFGPGAMAWDRFITFHGTVHHELSHALFSILTGAKIAEMNLWNPNSNDGSLGHVTIILSKNKTLRSIQRFFSAIAPLVMACITTSILGSLLLNPLFTGESNIIEMISMLRFWIFIILVTPILYHATMSKSDIKMALSGSWFIILVLIAIALISPTLIMIINQYITIIRNFVLLLMLIPITLGFLFRFAA